MATPVSEYRRSISGIKDVLGHYVMWKVSGKTGVEAFRDAIRANIGVSHYKTPAPSVILGRAITLFNRKTKPRYKMEKRGHLLHITEMHKVDAVVGYNPVLRMNPAGSVLSCAPGITSSVIDVLTAAYTRCLVLARDTVAASDVTNTIVSALDSAGMANVFRIERGSNKVWFIPNGHYLHQNLLDLTEELGNKTGVTLKLNMPPIANTTEGARSVTESFEETIAGYINEIKEATDAWDGTDSSKAVGYLKKFKEVKMKLSSAGSFYSENVEKLNKMIDLATQEVVRKSSASAGV